LLFHIPHLHLSFCLQHLVNLLAAPDLEVVAAALQTFQVLLRKTHHTSARWTPPAGVSKKLLGLSRGGEEREEGAIQTLEHGGNTSRSSTQAV
jgi:hypothetical protein